MTQIIDAYAHVGFPHYGRPEEALDFWRLAGVEKGCLVLPPGMPDLAALEWARQAAGERVRVFGIPFGENEADRARLTERQVALGISGLRIMPGELLDNPGALRLLGEGGLCLMAINLYESEEAMRTAIGWLERHERGFIAAPHFLKPATIESGSDNAELFRELLSHPRMHAIFSRQGGCSGKAFPYANLKPWIEEVAEILTWKRVLWGSEFPVLFHRDERIAEALDWLGELELGLGEKDRANVLGDNAQRLFFDAPAPKPKSGASIPEEAIEGLRSYWQSGRTVPAIRTRELALPLGLHGRLLSVYLDRLREDQSLRFQELLVELIEKGIGGEDDGGVA